MKGYSMFIGGTLLLLACLVIFVFCASRSMDDTGLGNCFTGMAAFCGMIAGMITMVIGVDRLPKKARASLLPE